VPDQNLVECQTCNLVYDSARIPECPRRSDRRRGSGFEVLSKSKHVRRKPVAGPPAEEVVHSAEGTLTITPSQGFGVATSRHRELSSVIAGSSGMTAIYFLVSFLAGAVSFSVAVNRAIGLPWNEAPVAVIEVARPYRVASHTASRVASARTERPAPAATAATRTDSALRVTPVRFDRDRHDGSLTWTGRLGNASADEMTDVRLTVTALDAEGHEVVSDTVELNPGRLAANESRVVQVRVHDGPTVARWVVGGSWLQARNQDVLYTADRPAEPQPDHEPVA